MTDIVSNGILPPSARNKDSPTHRLPLGGVGVSSSQLCNNLIQFAEQLSMLVPLTRDYKYSFFSDF